MTYQDSSGFWRNGDAGGGQYSAYNSQGQQGANVSGLDPSKVSVQNNWTNPNPNYSGNRATTTYNGPEGTWQNSGGNWVNGSGQQVQNLAGYLKAGSLQQGGADFSGYQNQLQGLLNDPSKIQQTAGYQFAVDQGNQAINRSAAAKGMSNSGNVLAELAKYGQGMASQEYGNQVNRLSGLMGQAQNFGINAGYYKQLPGNQQVSMSAPQSVRNPAPQMGVDYNGPMGTTYNPQGW